MNFNEIAAMANCFSKLTVAIENAQDLYDLITGKGDQGTNQILSTLESIDADIISGFDNVVQAIDDQPLVENWLNLMKPVLQNVHDASSSYLSTLRTLKPDTFFPSGYSIALNETDMKDFATWATDENAGPLTQIPAIIAPCTPKNTDDNLYNLILSNGLIDIYIQLIQTAQQSSDNPSLSGFGNQTVFDGVINLMKRVFQLVGTLAYTYEATLYKLNQLNLNPNHQFISLQESLTANFGSVHDESTTTVWGLFAQKLQTICTIPKFNLSSDATVNTVNPTAQIMSSAYTQDNWLGDGSNLCNTIGGLVLNALPFSSLDIQPNSFITSFNFAYVEGSHQGDSSPYEGTCLMLQCQIATLQQNSSSTSALSPVPIPGNFPATNDQAVMENCWIKLGAYYHLNIGSPNVITTGSDSLISVLFISPPFYPSQNDPNTPDYNKIKVATGFQLVWLGNRLAIALQYGDLDVSTPESPTITLSDPTYHSPGWYGGTDTNNNPNLNVGYVYCALPGYLDLRPSGNSTLNNENMPVTIPEFITNVTFATGSENYTAPPGENENCNLAFGNRLYIVQQSAAPIYMADFFQPANLIKSQSSQTS